MRKLLSYLCYVLAVIICRQSIYIKRPDYFDLHVTKDFAGLLDRSSTKAMRA